MDCEDEGTWNGCDGSVSLRLFVVTRLHIVELTIVSMAAGLGMTPEEWEELKGNVDDSFWVMRIIGS